MEANYDIAYDNPDSDSIGDMALHAALIGVAGYALMRLLLKQDQEIAMKHSALGAAAVFGYMGTFGHGAPPELRGPFFTQG